MSPTGPSLAGIRLSFVPSRADGGLVEMGRAVPTLPAITRTTGLAQSLHPPQEPRHFRHALCLDAPMTEFAHKYPTATHCPRITGLRSSADTPRISSSGL